MKALEIWPYFGSEEVASDVDSKSYSTPQSVYCLGRYSKVRSWRDVLTFTLDTLYEELPEYFEQIVKAYPKWFAKDERQLRAPRLLSGGYYIEVNDSANTIYSKCQKILEAVHLVDDDWKAEYEK